MAKKKKSMGSFEVWSWVALATLVLIVVIESTFSLTNAWELSTLTTNLKKYSTGASVLLEEKARMAQEAMMEKDQLQKEMTAPIPGMATIYTEPDTKVMFMVDPSGKYTHPSQYTQTETTKKDGVISVTFEKSAAGTEDPNDDYCTATFEISPRERAVVTKDIVFRNPLYTVTTKEACGITVDIKR